jgi:hypothetical protein
MIGLLHLGLFMHNPSNNKVVGYKKGSFWVHNEGHAPILQDSQHLSLPI